MRSGALDRRIALQRKATSQAPSGQQLVVWHTYQYRAASMRPVRGTEGFTPPAEAAHEWTEFSIRYDSSPVNHPTPLDRIVYPPPPDTSPDTIPATSIIYDIEAVLEIGRREGFKIIARRTPDVEGVG